MVRPFETLNVDVCCLGNHELELGIEPAVALMAKTKKPWLMTNLLQKESGNPIADCLTSYVINKNEFKFGFVGFADKEWFDILPPDIPINEYEYIDYNESLRKHS